MSKIAEIACGKQEYEKAIKAIGQELIRRASDITNDIEYVFSIEIKAKITPDEVVNFDVTKNYAARFEDTIERTELGDEKE